MAGSQNLKFQKGRAVLVMLVEFPLIYEKTMYAPDAPCSQINYRNLRASQIHISTALDRDEEVMELRKERRLIATVNAGDEGLYKFVIKEITKSPISLTYAEEVCMAA